MYFGEQKLTRVPKEEMLGANFARWDVRLSPYKLSLLALIRAHVDAGQLWVGRQECRHALGLYLSDEVSLPSDAMEKDLTALCEDLEGLPDGETLTTILQRMLEALESPDAIVDFFTDLSVLLEQPEDMSDEAAHLEGTSTLGIFVRRMMLAFNRMQFDGLSRLWNELEQFKDVGRGSFSGNLSNQEAEKFVSALIDRLDSNWGKQHTRPALDAMIDGIKASNPTVIRTHFLSYLNCIIHGDFGGAVDSMHQYFDYSFQAKAQDQHMASAVAGSAGDAAPSFTSFLPYATLNLASIHLRFGHKSEALELIHETIRLVQERTDDACLTLSLFQLQALAAANGATHLQLELLKQCLSRSLELMMPISGAESLINLSNHLINNPREQSTLQSSNSAGSALSAVQPMASFQHLHGAMRAALQGDPDSATKVLNNVLVQWSNLFDLVGQSDLSALYTRAAASHDEMSSHVRLANQYASFGDFKLALRILIEADRKFNPHRHEGVGPRASTEWQRAVRQILFDWSVYRCNYDAAEIHSTQLAALSQAEDNIPARVDSQIRSAVLLLHREQYVAAHKIISAVLAEKQNAPHPDGELHESGYSPSYRPQQRILLLITLAEILIESGNGLAAMPHLMSALSLCDQYHMESLRLSATILQAEIHLEYLSSIERARELLIASQPAIKQHGSLALQLRSTFLLAKIAMASANEPADLAAAEQLLLEALSMSKRLDYLKMTRQIFYLLARLYHEMENDDERDEAAAMFDKLNVECSQSRDSMSLSRKSFYYLDIDALANLL